MSLPRGFAARLADDLLCDGDLVVGGTPLTVVRLSPAARELLVRRRVVVHDDRSAQLARRLLDAGVAHPELSLTDVVEPSDLTVVVPVRDRAEKLDRTLRAVAGLRCIVVDDASDDRVGIADACLRHGALLHRLEQNVGPTAARNAGLALVTTGLVAFVDSDVEVSAEELLRIAGHFADPAIAAVGPRIVGRSRSARPRWFERYDAIASPLDVGPRPGRVRPGARAGWLPSACLVARTAALGAGFDPELRLGEDVDLMWRLGEDGWTVRYEPAVTAHHATRGTARAWLCRICDYGSSAAPLDRRHRGAVAPAVLEPGLAVAAAAVLVRSRWSVPASLVAVAVTTLRVRRALPASEQRDRVALRIGVQALGWGVRQEASLLVRHWWPAAVLAAAASRPARRALLSAAVVDTCIAVHQSGSRDLIAVSAGRRASDLAYGLGVWRGCWRERSVRALLPRRTRRSH